MKKILLLSLICCVVPVGCVKKMSQEITITNNLDEPLVFVRAVWDGGRWKGRAPVRVGPGQKVSDGPFVLEDGKENPSFEIVVGKKYSIDKLFYYQDLVRNYQGNFKISWNNRRNDIVLSK